MQGEGRFVEQEMRRAKSDPESKGNALSCGDAGGLDKTAGKGDSEQKRSEEGGR